MKIKSKNMKDLDLNEDVDIRSANDLVIEARRRPHPRPLLGELWQEGELAILFGAVGCGKSTLAIQLAESIARGRPAQVTLLLRRGCLRLPRVGVVESLDDKVKPP